MINEAIYERLKQAARDQTTVFYGEIAQIAGLNLAFDSDHGKLGQLLGAISLHEHESGRPMLSALVVNKDTGYPSASFFEFARKLGKYNGHSEMEMLTYYARELQAVFDCWAGTREQR